MKPKNPLKSATPVTDSFNSSEFNFADTEFQAAAERLRIFQTCALNGFFNGKRDKGVLKQLLVAMVCWAFMKQNSVKIFCQKHLDSFVRRGMSTFYRFLGRDNVNWRGISSATARRFIFQNDVKVESAAFVVDDTVKHRYGGKVEGSSTHFDHTEGRCVLGQQVVQLGLSHDGGFVPLDSQIYVGSKNRHGLEKGFSDGRSAVARDYATAIGDDKNEMLRSMVNRALRNGIRPCYILADSWFCNKGNLAFCLDSGLVPVMRMKNDKTKYLFEGKMMTLDELYRKHQRIMVKCGKTRWKTVKVVVELDLGDGKGGERWIQFAIVFSAPREGGKNRWAAFICGDIEMSDIGVLEVYSTRWGVEVYFREVKQNMGWMAEETGLYAVHYASIHLAALRYIILSDAVVNGGFDNFAQARDGIGDGMEKLSFMKCLWEIFKGILWGVLDRLAERFGPDMMEEVKLAVSREFEELLENALQIDENYLGNEIKGLKLENAA